MDVYILSALLLIVFLVVIVSIVIYYAQKPTSSVDSKSDGLKNRFISVSKHNSDIEKTIQEDSKLHARIDETIKNSFDGNYENLKNKPYLFDGDYDKLKNKPNINKDELSDYNKLINKPDLFNGHYDSLIGKPLLFDGNWSNLHHMPLLFNTSWEKVEGKPDKFDTTWGQIEGKPEKYQTNWNMIDGKPPLNIWSAIQGKPNKFDTTWGQIENKPNKFDTTWGQIDGKPDKFDTTWGQIQDKPNKFDTTWAQIDGKPDKFPTNWDMIEGKPPVEVPQEQIDTWDKSEIKVLLDEKASTIHTHNISDIQGFNPAEYALLNHNHAYTSITGLSEELEKKQQVLTAGDNIVISGNEISALTPNLEPYATKTEVTNNMRTKEQSIQQKIDQKQNKLTAGTNISIDENNTISASHPNLDGYATKTSLNEYATKTSLSGYATNASLNQKQNKLSNTTDISVKNITASGSINGVSKTQMENLKNTTSDIQSQINRKANSDHNHDSVYAKTNHIHYNSRPIEVTYHNASQFRIAANYINGNTNFQNGALLSITSDNDRGNNIYYLALIIVGTWNKDSWYPKVVQIASSGHISHAGFHSEHGFMNMVFNHGGTSGLRHRWI